MIRRVLQAVGLVKPDPGGDKPTGKRSSKWPGVRKAHLEKFPTCAACGARERLEVHHCKPFHLYPEQELDPANLITLCESPSANCHLLIGHGKLWKAWNPLVRVDAARLLRMILQRREAA